MSLDVDYNPMKELNTLIPFFRKVFKGFRDNGDYSLVLNFYEGGLRAPRILNASDKQKIKNGLGNFLHILEKPRYTGQIEFLLKHAEFTDYFNLFPGRGSFDVCQKEGIKFKVSSLYLESEKYCQYYLQEIDTIEKK